LVVDRPFGLSKRFLMCSLAEPESLTKRIPHLSNAPVFVRVGRCGNS